MNKPNLETAYYTSQLVVAVAVVLSLVFVGIQIQQNTRAIEHETYAALGDQATIELSLTIGAGLPNAWHKSIVSPETLQPEEIAQVMSYMFIIFHNRLAEFRQFQQGTLTEKEWRDLTQPMVGLLNTPWHRHWWDVTSRMRFVYSNPEFVQYVNQLLVEQPQDSLLAYRSEIWNFPGNSKAGAAP